MASEKPNRKEYLLLGPFIQISMPGRMQELVVSLGFGLSMSQFCFLLFWLLAQISEARWWFKL
jgi:hypothetical protein